MTYFEKRAIFRGMETQNQAETDLDSAANPPKQVIVRSEKGQFLPGTRPPPVLPPRGYGGRVKALQTLDAMMGEEQNQQILREALQKSFERNPMKFFRQIIMPLLPKETRLEMASEGKVLWTRISEQYPPEEPRDEYEVVDGDAVPL